MSIHEKFYRINSNYLFNLAVRALGRMEGIEITDEGMSQGYIEAVRKQKGSGGLKLLLKFHPDGKNTMLILEVKPRSFLSLFADTETTVQEFFKEMGREI